jgi:hypothetical protein
MTDDDYRKLIIAELKETSEKYGMAIIPEKPEGMSGNAYLEATWLYPGYKQIFPDRKEHEERIKNGTSLGHYIAEKFKEDYNNYKANLIIVDDPNNPRNLKKKRE